MSHDRAYLWCFNRCIRIILLQCAGKCRSGCLQGTPSLCWWINQTRCMGQARCVVHAPGAHLIGGHCCPTGQIVLHRGGHGYQGCNARPMDGTVDLQYTIVSPGTCHLQYRRLKTYVARGVGVVCVSTIFAISHELINETCRTTAHSAALRQYRVRVSCKAISICDALPPSTAVNPQRTKQP